MKFGRLVREINLVVCYSLPLVWNNLPLSVHSVHSLDLFKSCMLTCPLCHPEHAHASDLSLVFDDCAHCKCAYICCRKITTSEQRKVSCIPENISHHIHSSTPYVKDSSWHPPPYDTAQPIACSWNITCGHHVAVNTQKHCRSHRQNLQTVCSRMWTAGTLWTKYTGAKYTYLCE